MLTRRTVLQLAATAAAARSLAPNVTAAEAARLLAEPATPVAGAVIPGPWEPVNVADPVAFAMGVEGDIAEDIINFQAPEELAAYVQARAGVLADLPILASVGPDHPWTKMDEAAYAWAGAAYLQGVAAGAQYEALRRALVGPRRVCRRCQGIGSLAMGADRNHATDMAGGPQTCPDCGGAGTVAAPLAAL